MPDWRFLANAACDIAGTPCYVMSEQCVRNALSRLEALESPIPLRHWVSLKTQPVARLVHAAIGLGLGIDVVSDYELSGAIGAGVPSDRILVNGVGKQHWLRRHRIPGLRVHFDSMNEARELAGLSRAMRWRVGLRCAIPGLATSVHDSPVWDQFGMTLPEMRAALVALGEAGVAVSGLHFHLHTSMQQAGEYLRALEFVADVAVSARFEPEYIDMGGGLPVPGETALDGTAAADTFHFGEFHQVLAAVPALLPSVREIWLENGRFLTGPAGALVMTVLDSKDRNGGTYLTCDGGRVNHARMASIERHEILLAPARQGALRETTICGPTCSAVDRLGSWMLPGSVRPGDRVIWLSAGAYHIPLETRFSTGLAPVVWFNERQEAEVVRERETPEQWWGQWLSLPRRQRAASGG